MAAKIALFIVLALLAPALAGCLNVTSPANLAAQSTGRGAGGADARDPCSLQGEVARVHASTLTGFHRRGTFTLAGLCRLYASFSLDHLVGSLNVAVRDPTGRVVLQETYAPGVVLPGTTIVVNGDVHGDRTVTPAPTGNWTYQADADHVVAFTLSITAR